VRKLGLASLIAGLSCLKGAVMIVEKFVRTNFALEFLYVVVMAG